MSDRFQPAPQGKDPELWKMAQKRAGFKRHLSVYITVNIFLWIVWAISGSRAYNSGLPWPLWTTLGWGIGIVFHYLNTYVNTGSSDVEKEYDNLTRNQSNNKL